MPSLDRVLKFSADMFAQSMSIIEKKGADYNRDQQLDGDTLFNLKVAELLGIVDSAERGILVRLSDKFMRLISLSVPGREAAVKDVSVLDTIRDVHNYTNYLGLLWLERKEAAAATEKEYFAPSSNLEVLCGDDRYNSGSNNSPRTYPGISPGGPGAIITFNPRGPALSHCTHCGHEHK